MRLGKREDSALVEKDISVKVSSNIRTTIANRLLAFVNPEIAARLKYDDLIKQVEGAVKQILVEEKLVLNERELDKLSRELADDLAGLGPLETLLKDDTITDIMVCGVEEIYIDKRGQGRHLTSESFRDAAHLTSVAQRIARNVGRKVDESSPLVDARLPDGSRVNIVLPPIALDGAAISIRKFPNQTLSLNDLMNKNSMSEDLCTFLKLAGKARLNIIVSGGTGSGKTTLLNAITAYFGNEDRIVTIEDAAELKVQQRHVVRLETRAVSSEGGTGVTQTDLVKNALRMNPDRIIVGEVRGGEAFDLLQGMNTGHDGSVSTLHANTPRDALTRLENMVLMAGFDLPARAIRGQIASAVDLVIQVEKMRDGVRRITRVSEVAGMEGDIITMQDMFDFKIKSFSEKFIVGEWVKANLKPKNIEKFRSMGLEAEASNLFSSVKKDF